MDLHSRSLIELKPRLRPPVVLLHHPGAAKAGPLQLERGKPIAERIQAIENQVLEISHVEQLLARIFGQLLLGRGRIARRLHVPR